MDKPEVFTQFNPPPYEGAPMGGECLVEAEGYIPAEKQIQSMFLAGERLVAGRREEYDFGPDEKIPDEIDIRTRRPNYDMADASQDLIEANARLDAEEARLAEEKAAKEKAALAADKEGKNKKVDDGNS